MKRFLMLTAVVIVFLSKSLVGQDSSTPTLMDQKLLLEDYDYLLKTLEETHPNLYAYIPEEEFLTKANELRGSINRPMSKKEYHKILLQTIALIKQGHTMVFGDGGYRDFLKTGGLAFPFAIKYFSGHIYVDENFSSQDEFVKGTEIIAINSKTVNRIIDDFSPYLRVRPNGYIGGTLAYNWSGFLWMIYNFQDEFTVTYYLPGDQEIKTKTIRGASLADISKKTHSTDKKDFEFILEPERKTAILTLNTFHLDFERFDSLVENVFLTIKKNSIENLIIDVRNNKGGNGNLVSLLLNYLTDQPYVASAGSQVKTSVATKHCYTTHPVLVDAIEQARKAEGDKPEFLKLVDCFLEYEPGTITDFPKEINTPTENPNRFNGNLFLLTSKETFSAGTLLAAQIKDNNIGTIVGEETSDNPSMYACIMIFQLPHTGISIQNSTQYSLRPGGYDDQHGVLPDFLVQPTFNDYMNGYDKVMNYTYWLIDQGIQL